VSLDPQENTRDLDNKRNTLFLSSRSFLLAEQVVRWTTDQLERFIGKARLDPASWQDLGTTIVDTLRMPLTDGEALVRLEKIIGSMSLVHDFQTGHLVRTAEGCRRPQLRYSSVCVIRDSGQGLYLMPLFDIPRATSAMNWTLRLLAVVLAAVALFSLDLRAISTEMSFFGGPAGLPLTPLGQGKGRGAW
jgi:hypothetical protein